MENNKRLGLFIIIVAAVLLLAMAVYTYVFNKQQNASSPTATSTAANPNSLMETAKKNQPVVNYTFSSTTEANRALNAEDLKKMALSFAERLGSYSNQSNYGNIEDLKIMMSDSMIKWADGYVAQLEKQNSPSAAYYGITTTAISGEVKKFDDKAGQAEILVTTQRQEMRGSGSAPKSFTQVLQVDFVKVKTDWKVNSAVWEK